METIGTLMTLTMIVLNVIKTAGDCPRSCECKWKSGKESVFCVDANMTEIPKQLDSGTQVLVLTGNRLQRVGADEFFNASLLNLQKIFLSRCKLEFIHRFSFRKIINLVELDLSYNDLPSVPSHTFEFIKELRELRLNGNPIVRLLNNAFKMVPRLTKLDLSECRIVYVEMKAFQGLEHSLEWLKLDKNKITNIRPQTLVNLGNLHGLELSGNPWNCSCGLRTLREWMLTQNVPHSVPPICKDPPRLSGKVWDKLELDEFACTPKIEAMASRKSGEEGSNVTMSCSINGIPEPNIRWLRKNHIIANLTGAVSGARKKLYIVQITKETSNLTILAADAQDNGVYVCRAENKAGKSEANITLTIAMKPVVKIWSLRMMIAVGVVSLLFATAVGLLTYCAWSLRKRKSYIRHPVTRRELMDGYEMNHKNPIGYNKINDYGNYCSSGATENAHGVSERSSSVGACRNRTSEATEGGERTETEQSSPQKLRRSDERGWSFPRMSRAEDGPGEFGHCTSSSGSEMCGPKGRVTPPPEDGCHDLSSFAMSSSILEPEPQYSRPDSTRHNSIFFTSGVPDIQKEFPDLLELSRTKENFINNNSFGTLPGKKAYKVKRTRHGSFGSESQSPLLPASSGDSCDSNFSFGGRSFFDKYTSLPTSPSDLSQTPILQILDGSSSVFGRSPAALKYQSWELEKFLDEYRHLQDQLFKMKESCENLKESNLKFGEGEEKSKGVESTTTISKIVAPMYLEDSSGLPGFLDEANNFGALYGGSGFLEEDNNNPKSIVSNSSNLKPVLGNSEAYWSSGGQFLQTLGNPDSRNSRYKS